MPVKDCRGFTLIEMTVAITVFGLLMTVIVALSFQGNIMWQQGKKAIDVQQSAAIAVERMAKEIRTCNGLLAVDEQSLTFSLTKKDGDGTTEYWVRYALDRNQQELTRQTKKKLPNGGYGYASSPLPVASNIKDISFRYYDYDGREVSAADDIKAAQVVRVEIELIGGTDDNETNNLYRFNDHKLFTSVAIRNNWSWFAWQ